MRELVLKQEKHCAKHKIGIATKVTNPIHAQRIGHIVGVNIRISSRKWCLKRIEKN